MRRWDDATYPEDLPDDERPQICVTCGEDCEPYDYDEASRAFICKACDEARKQKHYAEVFMRR